MTLRIFVAGSALACLVLFTGACRPGGGPSATAPETAAAPSEPAQLAAEVNGTPITIAELDEQIKEDLFRSRARNASELYALRMRFLERNLADRVLEMEAKRRNTSVESLLESEVAALGPVTDEEVALFYTEHEKELGGVGFEDTRERIRDFLTDQRESQARQKILEEADIVIHIDQPRVAVAATGPAKGPEDAGVTIVEFSDFECPFCRRAAPTIAEVLGKYPDDVRLVYRQFPLPGHRRARPAAEAALCAAEQDAFWPYHDRLFANAQQLADEDLLRHAEELGLDQKRFAECFEARNFSKQIDADVAAARAAGVTGTPAFFINGLMISGAKPAADFYEIIDRELERLGKSPTAQGGGTSEPAS